MIGLGGPLIPPDRVKALNVTESALSTVDTLRSSRSRPNTVLTANHGTTRWEDKVRNTIDAGAERVFCVFDFDRTTTRCFLENGDRSLDCHDILASIPKITPECKHKLEEMMDYYYPIEIDANMSREEKIPHMEDWYH